MKEKVQGGNTHTLSLSHSHTHIHTHTSLSISQSILYPPFLLYLSPYCNPSAYGLRLANWQHGRFNFDFFPLIKWVTQFLIKPFPSNEEKKCLSKTCFTFKRESDRERERVGVPSLHFFFHLIIFPCLKILFTSLKHYFPSLKYYFPPCSLFLSFDTILSLKHLSPASNV